MDFQATSSREFFPVPGTVVVAPNAGAHITMTSLELVEFINTFRRAQAEKAGAGFPSKGYAELRHADFMAKVTEVLGIEAERNFSDCYQPVAEGRKYPCYRLPKREACLMAMSYSYELQAAVFDRMTLLEEQARSTPLPDTPESIMARAVLIAQDTIKQLESRTLELEAKVEQDKPKVLFADAISVSDTTILVRDLAKLIYQSTNIKIGEQRLYAWLRENGYLIRQQGTSWNMPTQRSAEMGLFVIKEGTYQHPDKGPQITKTPKITGKGQNYFINKFLEIQRAEQSTLVTADM